ncbi:DUF167 domain-containing protein [Candidatus Peregrinibacteria bacterium]|jgi:uncharacterized protein|nr:DUF167 domain-containing protein [Candidatus Peregrinibacteria bacterium]MBT4631658.1 DUF167 domain-containing protein [Candidatus Peregrinibacteria bacterium]MBT5516786.1 DUF167 domain-containing protein [Candidatus Peregrinibacteria bacterium]MBT5823932.1 DUF167 domain-containing protein [Candidatus Peregrinibacteria bacterium]
MSDPKYITVKVIPKSQRTEIVETMKDGTIKIRLKATPQKGEANKALIKFLAKEYGISKDDIKIISGHTSQKKLLRIKIHLM